jgi:hypothetical protein
MALRLHNRRWYPLIFLIGSATSFAVWLCFPGVRRQELLVSAIGGFAGLTYFLYRQHLDEAKLFKELFAEFNARYDALNDDLNTILFGPRRGREASARTWFGDSIEFCSDYQELRARTLDGAAGPILHS